MIKFNFKIDKETITAEVPEGWHEVKIKHLVNLENKWSGNKSDMIGLLSAFTSCTYEQLEQAKGNLWEPLFGVMAFVFNSPKWDKLKKQPLLSIGNKLVKAPKKLELETFGQKVLAMNVIASEGEQINKIPEILAIYLQPAIDGKFITDRVEQIKEDVLNMYALEAMPYGIFFFKKLLRLRSYGRIGLKASRRIRKQLVFIAKQAQISYNNLQTSLQ